VKYRPGSTAPHIDNRVPLEKLPVQVRLANDEDINFIFSSWLKSFKTSNLSYNVVNTIYYTEQHKTIEKILKSSTVLVACNSDDPTQVYAWACGERIDGIFCLHYVYTKHNFRSMGFGKLLLNGFDHDFKTAGICSHYTKIAERLAPKYNLLYHPYVLFSTFSEQKEKSDE
jgi:hypothetical protein